MCQDNDIYKSMPKWSCIEYDLYIIFQHTMLTQIAENNCHCDAKNSNTKKEIIPLQTYTLDFQAQLGTKELKILS